MSIFRALFIGLLLTIPAAAQDASQLTQEQLRDYVELLRADRAAYQQQLDVMRLQLQSYERARQEHDARVDAFWRAYTGLDKKK